MKQAEEVGFAAVLFVIFAVFVGLGWGYNATARIVPLTVSIPGLAISAIHLARLVRRWRSGPARPTSPETVAELVDAVEDEVSQPQGFLQPRTRKMLGMWAWIVALAGGIYFFGFLVTTPCFLLAFIRFFAKRSWAQSLTIAASFTLCMYVIFYVGLKAQL